ncbi:MAG: hypothetical protein AAGJ85_02670, partial [Pseudomonadota bacterium]
GSVMFTGTQLIAVQFHDSRWWVWPMASRVNATSGLVRQMTVGNWAVISSRATLSTIPGSQATINLGFTVTDTDYRVCSDGQWFRTGAKTTTGFTIERLAGSDTTVDWTIVNAVKG